MKVIVQQSPAIVHILSSVELHDVSTSEEPLTLLCAALSSGLSCHAGHVLVMPMRLFPRVVEEDSIFFHDTEICHRLLSACDPSSVLCKL